MKVAVSWSGGKDSCLACYRALEEGFEVHSLLTMMNYQGNSSFHLISGGLLDAQSEAMNTPIVKCCTSPEKYEMNLKKALKQLRSAGTQGLVTGDICEVAHHEGGWLERICRETDMKPIKPLWRSDSRKILDKFLSLGFKAKIIRVKLEFLDKTFLGRDLDEKLQTELAKLKNVDACGERGEFHTLVTDGPLFKKRIEILETRKSTAQNWGRLEILRFRFEPKGM